MTTTGIVILAVAFLLLLLAASSIRIVQEYERGVIFRLGRVIAGAKGPGLFFIIPVIDRMVKVNLQIVTLDVPPQDVITRDNVTVRVNAVCYFQVFQPVKAIVEIQNYLYATSQIAQTTLRAVLSKADLDDILGERERRAKIINAEGEFQASERLAQAAAVIARHPIAYQLRYLQTVTEV